MGELATYILPALGAVAAGVWLYIILVAWSPAARKRGGRWYLEAIFLLAGPVAMLLTALEVTQPSLERPAAMAGQALTALVTALSAGALAAAMGNARKGGGRFVFAVVFFYGALLLSGLFGKVMSFPPVYFITPLIVLAFLCHGGYTYQWLLRTALVSLRVAILLSFAAIWFFPETAFNTEETRTFFGIERLAGIAGHPNGLAALAALGLFLELRSGSRKIWALPFIAAIVLAQSSTGYFVALAGVLIMVLYRRPVLRWLAGAGMLTLFGFLTFMPSGAGALAKMLGLDDPSTFNGRGRIWAAAMQGFDLSPFWGYGPELLGERFRSSYLPGADFATHAHNQFVQTIASTGLVGALSLAVLLLTVLVAASRTMERTGGLGLALIAYLLLRSATETPLKPSGVGFGTLTIALVVSLLAVAWSERAKDKPLSEPVKPAQRPIVHSPQVWS